MSALKVFFAPQLVEMKICSLTPAFPQIQALLFCCNTIPLLNTDGNDIKADTGDGINNKKRQENRIEFFKKKFAFKLVMLSNCQFIIRSVN